MGGDNKKIVKMLKAIIEFIPMVLPVFVILFSIYYLFHREKTSIIELAGEPFPLVLMSDLKVVKLSVENLRQMLDSLTIPNEAKTTVQLNKFRLEINEMKSSLKKIEEVILDDPVKALRLPLMQKELDNIRATYRNEITNIRSEINRVYDMSKWLFYIMITMSVALLGVAITGFYQSRRG